MTILVQFTPVTSLPQDSRTVTIAPADPVVMVRVPSPTDPPREPAVDPDSESFEFEDGEPTWEDAEWQ